MQSMTVRICSYLLLKRISRILLFLLMTASATSAQEYQLIDSLRIGSLQKASIDKFNNIYLVSQNGGIDKYDINGTLLTHFSPNKPGDVTLIEAWNPLKVFALYGDFQECLFLDRFLVAENRFSLTPISSYIGLATISADNNLWLVDYSDFSLKKYDLPFGQVTIQRPFDLLLDPNDYDLTFMREYQNLLFLSESSSGILVFDNLGNYLNSIQEAGIDYFSFFENELYYLKGNVLYFQDIYNHAKREVEIPKSAHFAFWFDTQLVLVTDHNFLIYAINE
ncbi:hypothetical protein FNH22_15010 [Fulvivirga sp. M361]|uniref:hypothetical protein n=1 Tax=Fulvivirga sp. M361 TaxID=2594266 RepID=UPI00117A34E6|nr:hypothetical protein [Fulvivirga sp. M361]TRX57717.1 hypothetical protein FNH22_15010 [Fulvivirga sp. M361]